MSMFPAERQTSIPGYERIDLLDASERDELIQMIDFAKVNKRLHEALYQLHAHGPVRDGDAISKSDRDALLEIRACAKVTSRGQHGFNACTYFGATLLRVFDWLHGPLARNAA